MLKHVSSRTLSRISGANKSPSPDQDNISLNISFNSLNCSFNDAASSSSGGSTTNVDISSTSRSSSSSSIQGIGLQKTVVKIYTKVLCSDVEYKALAVTKQTTCKEVVQMLLHKFRLRHLDLNLFYLTMEVWFPREGIPTRNVLVLDDDASLAQLQSCYPQKDLKFSLMIRPASSPTTPSTASKAYQSNSYFISEAIYI